MKPNSNQMSKLIMRIHNNNGICLEGFQYIISQQLVVLTRNATHVIPRGREWS